MESSDLICIQLVASISVVPKKSDLRIIQMIIQTYQLLQKIPFEPPIHNIVASHMLLKTKSKVR
ncbi:hypothetical protein C0966_02460 [Bacillus methanolicus]|nr:hypothetical protein [Bacillus methanolicus]